MTANIDKNITNKLRKAANIIEISIIANKFKLVQLKNLNTHTFTFTFISNTFALCNIL